MIWNQCTQSYLTRIHEIRNIIRTKLLPKCHIPITSVLTNNLIRMIAGHTIKKKRNAMLHHMTSSGMGGHIMDE